MKNPNKKQRLVLGGLLASPVMVAMPVHTIWFGTRQDPFSYTLSMIGNRFDLMTDFLIWGIFTGLAITIFLLQVYRRADFRDPKARRYLLLSGLFLVLTVATPAVEEVNAFTHKLHALFAVLFGIFLSISMYFFLRYLKTMDLRISRRFSSSYAGIILSSLLLLVILGANGIFEIFFFLALAAYLLILNKRVRKLIRMSS